MVECAGILGLNPWLRISGAQDIVEETEDRL